MLATLKDKTLDYKLPVFSPHNTHGDEQPGIDIIWGLSNTLCATKEKGDNFSTTDEAGNAKTLSL